MPQEFRFIDLSYLEQLAEGNPQLMKDMIVIFKKQVPEMMKGMRNSARDKNWDILRKNFHKAKASASIMGMNSTASELSALEKLTTDPSFQSEPFLKIEEIEFNFAGAMDELDRYILFRQNN